MILDLFVSLGREFLAGAKPCSLYARVSEQVYGMGLYRETRGGLRPPMTPRGAVEDTSSPLPAVRVLHHPRSGGWVRGLASQALTGCETPRGMCRLGYKLKFVELSTRLSLHEILNYGRRLSRRCFKSTYCEIACGT